MSEGVRASQSGDKSCYFSSSLHKIVMKFGQKVHLRCRMKVYQVHQNLRPIGWVMGWNSDVTAPGTLSPHLYTELYLNLITSFISGEKRRCIKHIKICGPIWCYWSWDEIGVQTAQGIFFLIYAQDLKEFRSCSVDCGCRILCTIWTIRPMNFKRRCWPNFVPPSVSIKA